MDAIFIGMVAAGGALAVLGSLLRRHDAHHPGVVATRDPATTDPEMARVHTDACLAGKGSILFEER